MNLQSSSHRSRRAGLGLVALESLPCGCVSALYQANPTVVELELVEAKGPHCVFEEHQMGRIVRLGMPEEILYTGDEAVV